jgi:hypothetical protein
MANFLLDIKETSEILGKENIECLINLFNEMDGKPPCVEKKRYRANYPDQIDVLNYLEQSAHLITTKTIQTQQFYLLRPYAIPLIKSQKAQNLLNLMCKIYGELSVFYKERLDENVTRDELLKTIDAPNGQALEALSYFQDTHSVHTGWGKEFPYEEGSHINISEGVLLKESFLEVLTDYYRWHFINQNKEDLFINNKILLPDKKPHRKQGRPSKKHMIDEAFVALDSDGKINRSDSVQSHYDLIRDTLIILYPDMSDDNGLSDETIRRAIREHFK